MNKKFIVVQIQQNETFSSVKLLESGKDNKADKKGAQVAIVFQDPKEAAKYEHGKVYTVEIK